MDEIIRMLPLVLFTLFGIIYHIGHNEYRKNNKHSNSPSQ